MGKKIAVVGAPGTWSTEKLADTLAEMTGFRLVIDMEHVWFDAEAMTVRAGDRDLLELDGLMIKKLGRQYSPNMLDRCEYLLFLERRGLPVFSSPGALFACINRTSCTLRLQAAGIPMPPTVCTEDPGAAVEAVRRFGEAIYKPLYSTKARGMKLLAGKDPALAAKVAELARGGGTLYIQKRINLPGQDLGVVFLGGDYLDTYARVSGSGSWNTTTRSGGRYEAASPTREIIDLADRAQRVFGLDFTSVDVAETDDGPVVFEVSAFGGFRGLHEAKGVDAARAYASFVLGRISS